MPQSNAYEKLQIVLGLWQRMIVVWLSEKILWLFRYGV